MIPVLGHLGCPTALLINWVLAAQINISKAGRAGCWLAHMDCFFRNDEHTPIKNGGSAERSQILNILFHVAINTQVFIRG